MASTPERIEVSFMYNRVKNLTEPKAVLEKLATLSLEMGWTKNVGEIRLMAYALWLKEHGKEDWCNFIEASMKAIAVILLDGMPAKIPEAPEGWIEPMEYINGRIPKEAGK